MTTYDTASSLSVPPTWARYLLGFFLILAGLFVLGDIVAATIISTMFIGIVAVAAGVLEIINAFWTKKWGGFVWQILLGILYVAFGAALFTQPVSSALMLTYFLGLLLLMSGLVRVLLSFSHWREAGWLMLLSGAFGVLAGLVVLTGFPKTGLWVLGLVLGIDLISHGAAWLTYAWLPAGERKR
ncbi:MAG: hypothetical protein V7604_64 [Hyphomicrobiales bacterium]|jgi:uncharacterized membrane protein HdeD (DUF308 family)